MKGGVRKKSYFIIVISNFFTLPILGWLWGGIYLASVGFILALLIDRLFPTWKYELTWKDIDTALNNIYLHGHSPCDLCFIVNNRRIYIYRDEKKIHRNNGTIDKRIRMAVCIPIKDWKDLLSKDDLHGLFKQFGGKAMFSSNRGPESYDVFASKGKHIEDCKGLLNLLFKKATGGLNPDIYASSIVNSKKNIWVK